jgi:hypothetical protein
MEAVLRVYLPCGEWRLCCVRTSSCSDFVTAAKAALLSLRCVTVLKGELG